jgi:hypothetical protein
MAGEQIMEITAASVALISMASLLRRYFLAPSTVVNSVSHETVKQTVICVTFRAQSEIPQFLERRD